MVYPELAEDSMNLGGFSWRRVTGGSGVKGRR